MRGVLSYMENNVHIRSSTSQWHGADDWNDLRENARDFLTVSAARDWCVQQGMVNVEIVVVRNALICMRIPLGERA